MINIIITDTRRAVLKVWQHAFMSQPRVECRLRGNSRQQIHADAFVMLASLAHDRFGGMPALGQSQILDGSRESDQNSSRWVVTTVPFPAKLIRHTLDDGTVKLTIAPSERYSASTETYILFQRMLAAIRNFNTHSRNLISSLRIDLNHLNFNIDTAKTEAEAAASAIGLHFSQVADELSKRDDVSLTEAEREVEPEYAANLFPQTQPHRSDLFPENRPDLINYIQISKQVKRQMESANLGWEALIFVLLKGDVSELNVTYGDVIFSLSVETSQASNVAFRANLDRRRGRVIIKSLVAESAQLFAVRPDPLLQSQFQSTLLSNREKNDFLREVYVPHRVKQQMRQFNLDWPAVIDILVSGHIQGEGFTSPNAQNVSFRLARNDKKPGFRTITATLDLNRGRVAVKNLN